MSSANFKLKMRQIFLASQTAHRQEAFAGAKMFTRVPGLPAPDSELEAASRTTGGDIFSRNDRLCGLLLKNRLIPR